MKQKLLERLTDILRRHLRSSDNVRSDHEFILAVHRRYLASRQECLIDPNE